MSVECESEQKYRIHKRISPITIDKGISRSPKAAPDPTKTMAELQKEIQQRIDTEINARNPTWPPICLYPCEEIDRYVARKTENTRRFSHRWIEKFELKDSFGNVMTGQASYTVSCSVKIKTSFHVVVCDKPYGDGLDTSDLILPKDYEWGLPPSYKFNLKEYHESLPDSVRKAHKLELKDD